MKTTEQILNNAEIEYLKKVNGIRKKAGLTLDAEQCKPKSFLAALLEETKSHFNMS
jgi:hypothetical protein